MASKLQQTVFQLEQTGIQNGKLLAEIADKAKQLEFSQAQTKEMATEIESLHLRLKQIDSLRQACQRLEADNSQLRAEVSTLQQARFDLQARHNEDIQAREQQLKSACDVKIQKKLAKE